MKKKKNDPEPEPDAVVDMKTLRVVSRTDWGARKPRFPGIDTMWNPAQFVFLRCYSGHTNETCDKEDDCKRVIKELQKFHFGTLTDIAHNFLIAKDGTIYEGRGWKVKSQTPDYDLKKIRIDQAKTLNLAFIGNFDKKDKTPEMIQAVKDLIDFGVQNKYIHERHEYFEVYEPQFPADDYGPRRVIGG